MHYLGYQNLSFTDLSCITCDVQEWIGYRNKGTEPFRSQPHSLPQQSESANRTLANSLRGTFAPWPFRTLANSFPGPFAPGLFAPGNKSTVLWNFRSMEFLLP